MTMYLSKWSHFNIKSAEGRFEELARAPVKQLLQPSLQPFSLPSLTLSPSHPKSWCPPGHYTLVSRLYNEEQLQILSDIDEY